MKASKSASDHPTFTRWLDMNLQYNILNGTNVLTNDEQLILLNVNECNDIYSELTL